MKRNFKKSLASVLVIASVVATMAGCGVSREDSTASTTTESSSTVVESTEAETTTVESTEAESTASSDELIPISFQSKWIPQDQFMGFYVAKEKGFYEEEGLDVTILPGGSDISVPSVVESGSAQLGVTNSYNLLSYQESGYPLVGISQVFQDSPFVLVCRKSAISSVEDLKGKVIGAWSGGNDAPVRALLTKYGIDPDMDVTLANQGSTIDGFLDGSFDAYSAMTYNELLLAYENGYTDDDLYIISMEEEGCGMLADAIFCSEEWLQDNKETAVKFMKATIKGWIYACENVEEATDIVYANMDESSADYVHQLSSGESVAKLVIPEGEDSSITGTIDDVKVADTIAMALKYGIITQDTDVDTLFDKSVMEEVLAEN